MSDWWTRYELKRVAEELQKIREERIDPTGTAGCLAILTMIAIPCIYIVPKTVQNVYKDHTAWRERSEFAKLPKEQQNASIRKTAIKNHAEYKNKLDEICIANETRWKHSEINCSYIKEDFIRNYCPPIHLFKDVSDPGMCMKLKKTSNNW
jgi:hypothetical protein